MPRFLLSTDPSDAPIQHALVDLDPGILKEIFSRAKQFHEMKKIIPDLLEMSFRNFHCKFFKEEALYDWQPELWSLVDQEGVVEVPSEKDWPGGDEEFRDGQFVRDGFYTYMFLREQEKGVEVFWRAEAVDDPGEYTTESIIVRDLERFL